MQRGGTARRPDSLLAFVKQLIQLRRQHDVLAGPTEVLPTDAPSVFAQRYGTSEDGLVILHNLAPDRVEVGLPLDPVGKLQIDPLLGGEATQTRDGRLAATLEPYGLRWWRICPN